MKVLDLFSGIGGFSLGLERAGMETIAFCEIDKFCQKVLKKHWPNVTIHDDITKLDGKYYAGTIDVICGGFPCQPFSVAGKQKGKDDNRYLWPEMLRVVSEAKPTWFIGENVPGIINMALEQVSFDLETKGYEVQTLVIPACAVNAPHRRSRTWILAHSEHARRNRYKEQGSYRKAIFNSEEGKDGSGEFTGMGASPPMADPTSQCGNVGKCSQYSGTEHKLLQSGGVCGDVAYANGERWKQSHSASVAAREAECDWEDYARGVRSFWDFEPGICRVHDGFPSDVERLKALGNAVVPQIPELIGKMITQIERNQK